MHNYDDDDDDDTNGDDANGVNYDDTDDDDDDDDSDWCTHLSYTRQTPNIFKFTWESIFFSAFKYMQMDVCDKLNNNKDIYNEYVVFVGLFHQSKWFIHRIKYLIFLLTTYNLSYFKYTM